MTTWEVTSEHWAGEVRNPALCNQNPPAIVSVETRREGYGFWEVQYFSVEQEITGATTEEEIVTRWVFPRLLHG